jgi:hypothetical protein
MPVQQSSFTHLRVLFVLIDRSSLRPNLTSVVDGLVCPEPTPSVPESTPYMP